jgi:NAD(P)-dependent dehydrogenase (short-subunit alcohol dehydrogenase family)
LNALVRALAVELAPDRIRANAVAPGGIRIGGPSESRMTQFVGGRSPEQYADYFPSDVFSTKTRVHSHNQDGIDDVAKAHLFLCSRFGDFVNGETLVVDGGFSIWNGT